MKKDVTATNTSSAAEESKPNKMNIISKIKRFLLACKYSLITYNLTRKRAALIRSIQERGTARVVFFVSNISMWKQQGLYDLMADDKRFEPMIVICPFATFTQQQKEADMQQLKQYFNSLNIPFIEGVKDPDCLSRLNPDIIFYPQPYFRLYQNNLDAVEHEDKLLCYSPYALFTVGEAWAYNSRLQVTAWKLFYQTEFHKAEAAKYCLNKGKNVEVTGEFDADAFARPVKGTRWKPGSEDKKRIIWAPHYSITGEAVVNRGSFIWLAPLMLELAGRYSDRIHFAFKPHPRLKSELYAHKDWGKTRTDEYYSKWETMTNTQLNDGEYVELFKESDALIHDSGSFTAVYHYTRKPSMFVASDIESVYNELNGLGRACLDLHYIGRNPEDIIEFIQNVVMNGQDTKADDRNKYVNEVLIPQKGTSSEQNVFNCIVETLGI